MKGLNDRAAARTVKQSAESEAANVKSLDATPLPLMLLTVGWSGCSTKHDRPVAVAQDGLPARIHLWDVEHDIMRFTENLKMPHIATAVREWGVAEIEKVQAGTTSDKSTIKHIAEDDLPGVILELTDQKPLRASVRTFRDANQDYLTIAWGSGRGLFGLVVSKQNIAPGRYGTITRVEKNIFVWSIKGSS